MTAATVLFAGCGGSSAGLENAGYQTIGYDVRAIAHCTPCHLDHLIEVSLTTRATNQPLARNRGAGTP